MPGMIYFGQHNVGQTSLQISLVTHQTGEIMGTSHADINSEQRKSCLIV